MLPNKSLSIASSISNRAARPDSDSLGRTGWSALILSAMLAVSAAATLAASPESSRETVIKIVAQIQKADYAGDRAALQHLYDQLKPFVADEKIGSRVNYWRGFALWRRAINGFNESADPKDLEHDLTEATVEFKEASAKDPALVDAKVGPSPASVIWHIWHWETLRVFKS